jgi:protein-disulfide isomerase
MSALTSAEVPAIGSEDHLRGDGRTVIAYLDLACPHCAATWARILDLRLRLALRHFPVASKHPRAPALHAAAEAAALQADDAGFWGMVDSIYADRGRVDDPHLWERARGLKLDLEQFERDRGSDPIARRVRRDFEGGIRAAVTGTPAFFADGRRIGEDDVRSLAL